MGSISVNDWYSRRFGIFGLGMVGLFASVFYVAGRIIGYAVMYWIFSLLQPVLHTLQDTLQVQILTTSILVDTLILYVLLAVRIISNEKLYRQDQWDIWR